MAKESKSGSCQPNNIRLSMFETGKPLKAEGVVMRQDLMLVFLIIVLVSMTLLGCSKGYKSSPNYKRLKTLSDQGSPVHQDSLAQLMLDSTRILFKGVDYGDKSNYKEPRLLLLSASKTGYYFAMVHLAESYSQDKGLEQYKWYNLAAAYCPQQEFDKYAKLRDEAKAKLSLDQVNKAQAEAMEFYKIIESGQKDR